MYRETVTNDSVREIHRYFPEWAARPIGPSAQHESDRNSYLAGGYADEFGYGAYPGWPPAIAPLDGDEPENSRLWREQIGALHPGYPECPKPLARGLETQSEALADGSSRVEPRARVGFRVIRVRARDQAPLGRVALRLSAIAVLAQRLMRRRHLNHLP